MISFSAFVEERFKGDGFSTEDAVACLLPLMRQVVEVHRDGMVAPLNGTQALWVDRGVVFFREDQTLEPKDNLAEIRQVEQLDRGPFDVVQVDRVFLTGDELTSGSIDRPTRPALVTGYRCWEQLLDHHDPLTDVYCLGQLLATVATGLDFDQPSDVQSFARHRQNLFAINPGIHPVIARAIVRMTELHRPQRPQDLNLLIRTLENYRHVDVQVSVEPGAIEGFETRDLKGKQELLLDRLQQRLFAVSRRNRLLHFRPTGQSINLTQASVPLSFDYRNIRENQILICDSKLERQICDGKMLTLNRHLNFSEAIYLPPRLNRIRREMQRDLTEYGFVQLRLVLCVLNWSNLKETPAERFNSPLVLVPVVLKKKRGVRDEFTLEPLTNDAEVNPVVRYLFREWYDIQLPERIDLEANGLNSLFEFMEQSIGASEPGVELEKIDRPRIETLQAQARRLLERYRQRARVADRGLRRFQGIDYSYDPANYLPLGIRLYEDFVKLPKVPVEPSGLNGPSRTPSDSGDRLDEAQDSTTEASQASPPAPKPETHSVAPTTRRRTVPTSEDRGAGNPYHWTLDLCQVTLANFRYRKMTLVRGYEQLLATTPDNQAFDAVFSLKPRDIDHGEYPALPWSDRFDVVPCDPTQASSIRQARRHVSCIIQGPPGTGKSQTITNLIADYVARGQRVLFVCEKRAAIDVVYARLRQCGLGPLCCLIHDSQADKKDFVMDLKETYQSFLSPARRDSSVANSRSNSVSELSSAQEPLEKFDQIMNRESDSAGLPNWQVLQRAIELQSDCPELSELQKERLPRWRSWNEARAAIQSLTDILKSQKGVDVLARHPLRTLRTDLVKSDQPVKTVSQGLEQSVRSVNELSECVRALSDGQPFTLDQLDALVQHAERLLPVADSGGLRLLDENHEEFTLFTQAIRELDVQREALHRLRKSNSAWKQKIARRDLQVALDEAVRLSEKWFPFFRPSWWRLRKFLDRSYDFSSHPIQPSWVSVLANLRDEYQAEDALQSHLQGIGNQFGMRGELDRQVGEIRAVRNAKGELENWLRPFHVELVSSPKGAATVRRLSALKATLQELRDALNSFIDIDEPRSLSDLHRQLDALKRSLDALPEYLACLEQLARMPSEVQAALKQLELPPAAIEAASLARAVELLRREDPRFDRFNRELRERCVERLDRAHRKWMDTNAAYVLQRTRYQFLEHVKQAEMTSAKGGEEQKFQKVYSAGRKILEHEFGKQMRYKSIRDLVGGESGSVVRDLKPVWLMSPLSVSDTLPLGEDDFDVVIFDEASQITLEAAVPTLFRAGQAIVVGDEQQLPPTEFFSSSPDEDEQTVTFEYEGESVSYDLESNSLLNHAARNLTSTMLGWHYRSRNELLISFSNWAFYEGRLLTIPEESIQISDRGELIAQAAEDAVRHAPALADRPISFHRIHHGVYLNRRNTPEAEYIANLIRECLMAGDGKTVGVIAFSEAQQTEIEEAIDRLAQSDPEFGDRLEAELTREDDGQFVGLLVKNLENIQGDERDIIILSVCYGPDDTGRMIMNFGPINKTGGEKRLNVAFSRAKHHMAVVSTITYSAITNEYNVGANHLRKYLHFAQAISAADRDSASSILRSLAPWRREDRQSSSVSPVLKQIADRVAERGFIVDFLIGQSNFRCDLGVRRAGDAAYRLGILTDAGSYYADGVELIDRELFRPRLLEVFGWNRMSLLMKDWLEEPDRIIEEIVQRCEGVTPGEPTHRPQ